MCQLRSLLFLLIVSLTINIYGQEDYDVKYPGKEVPQQCCTTHIHTLHGVIYILYIFHKLSIESKHNAYALRKQNCYGTED